MEKVFLSFSLSFALFLPVFMKNKVAVSSLRVMYLLALLCTEIGGNLFSRFLFTFFYFFSSLIQRHQWNFFLWKIVKKIFLKLRGGKERKSFQKLWIKMDFRPAHNLKKSFMPSSCFSTPRATTLLINSSRKLFSASIYLHHLNIQTINVMGKVCIKGEQFGDCVSWIKIFFLLLFSEPQANMAV